MDKWVPAGPHNDVGGASSGAAAATAAFASDKAPLLDKKAKAGPTGRAAHYTGRMTLYVLVVALVSATGGMLFG